MILVFQFKKQILILATQLVMRYEYYVATNIKRC